MLLALLALLALLLTRCSCLDNRKASAVAGAACPVIYMTGTPPVYADLTGAYALQPANTTGGRPAYFNAGSGQWLYFVAEYGSWRVGPVIGGAGHLFAYDTAQTPDAITHLWQIQEERDLAPSVKATCPWPPSMPPLAPHAHVLVDNTNTSAKNTPGCGVDPVAPCLNISYGVVQALKQTAGGALPTVHVQGGGAPYLGECSSSTATTTTTTTTTTTSRNSSSSSLGRGIVIPLHASLAVVGLNATRDGAFMSAPVIDCEGKGRAFTFGDGDAAVNIPTGSAAVGGVRVQRGAAASQLVLQGLVVRNGNASSPFGYQGSGGAVWASGALVLRNCTFENCSSRGSSYGGGAVYVLSAQLIAEDSRFTRCSCSGSLGGGAVLVWFNGTATDITTVLSACHFEDTTSSGRLGGGVLLVYHYGIARNTTTTVADCSFTGCSATVGSGGALLLSAPAGSTSVSLEVARCHFRSNTASHSGSSGGAISVLLPGEVPANLDFVGDPNGTWVDPDGRPIPLPHNLNEPCSGCNSFPGCGSCPTFGALLPPVIPREHKFRRWEHVASKNTFALYNSSFVGNSAAHSGGALSAPSGGDGTIAGCLFKANDATLLFGGGVSLGGSVKLSVSGSQWSGNTCGQTGCQVYSSSGAGVFFRLNSSVELGCASGGSGTSCRAGIAAVQSGNWTWDAWSGMSCAPGYVLMNSSMPAYDALLDSWQLKAPVMSKCGPDVAAADCLVAENATNCACYFSTSNLSYGFGNATITPKVLVSALSYACIPCTAGTSGTARSWLNGSDERATVGVCSPCVEGQHQSATGAAHCESCSPNTYQIKSGQRSCVNCDSNQYQLEPGQNATLPCPYGGACSSAGVVARSGFWGGSSSTAVWQLVFFRCPSGFCCDGSVVPCDSIDRCAGNRSGWLCGGCALGFAQTIGSTACRAEAQCGGADAGWFVLGALLLAALFAFYARKTQAGGGSGFPLNAINTTLYFYQVAQLLSVGSTAGVAMLALLNGASNMQWNGGGGGAGLACPFATLTTLQAIELEYAVPALALLVLALGYCAEAKEMAAGSSSMTLQHQYEGALAKLLMLAYSQFASTTFKLLHCVDFSDAAGGGRALFRAATQACGVWQAPFYVVAAVLLLSMAAAFAVAAGVGAAAQLSLPAPLTARLRAPYCDDCGHWEAVLALHRLAVVAVHSFGGGDSAVTAVLQTLTCGTALVVHVMYRPFRERSANRAQTALLACLVVVAVLNVPQAMLDTNALATSPTASALVEKMRDVEAVLLLAPGALVGAALLALAWRQRRSLAREAAAGCAALAGCSCVLWARVMATLNVSCCGAAADEEAPFDEPLLPSSSSRSKGRSSKLVDNSRGLRLTNRTSADSDGESGGK
jgi:hypothetical protein